MDIEIVYYEQSSGVLQKVAELVVQTKNASLGQICREALQEVRYLITAGRGEVVIDVRSAVFVCKQAGTL